MTDVTTGRRLELDDLHRLATITDAQISPDGALVAYAVRRADPGRNEHTSALWLAVADGRAAPRQLTTGSHRDTTPRWSPDGRRLAFLSDRDGGKPQLYLLDRDAGGWGGEPRRLTNVGRGVTEPAWSPDGRQIAFTTTEGTGLADAERDTPGGTIRHITRRRYRFDTQHYIDDRFSHLWTVDAETGATHQLTRGEHDNLHPAWSPDGKRLAFASSRGREHLTWDRFRLHVIDLDGDAPAGADDPATSLGPNTLSAGAPSWSPDGSTVAFIGQREGEPGGSNGGLWAVPAAGGDSRNLAAALDRAPGTGASGDFWAAPADAAPIWTPDGRGVLFTACDEGRVSLFRAALDGTVSVVVGGERVVGAVSVSADGARLAFVAGSITNPCDLYASGGDGGGETRLTELNRALLDGIAIQPAELFRFESWGGGFQVDAWLIRPVGYREGRTYPLVHVIHGGPHGAYGYAFSSDMQLWASAGYHVLFVNPRASTGYGEAFGRANNGDWGHGDGRELGMALDLVLERGGVDPKRLAVVGLSYGGYMVNWLIGHDPVPGTPRYACAVSENSIANLLSNSLASDLQMAHPDKDMIGGFWDNLHYYLERSPIAYAPLVKTPTLFIQSEQDWRCPNEEGEQMYSALKIHGIEAEMVRFPGESHGFLRNGRPTSRHERRRHLMRWLARYLDRP